MKQKDNQTLKKSQIMTFTKKWTNRILWFCLFWVTCSYGLALIGREQIAQSLSNNIVKVILGVFIAYAIRGFTDTYFEKKHELKVKELESEEQESE